MCGRFVLLSKNKIKSKYNIKIKPNYNISPGSYVLVIDNRLKLIKVKWGFTPYWSKDLRIINARIETLFQKPTFKRSIRCVFLADGYFEWKREGSIKQPYYHYLNNSLLYFAGIFNLTSGCCIITVNSQEHISHIHHRQPFLLLDEQISDWLSGEPFIKDRCSSSIIIDKVSSFVNTPKNNSPECIEPI